MDYKVFISYSWANKPEIYGMIAKLESNLKGLKVIIDDDYMHAGDRIGPKIEAAIRDADALACLFTEDSIQSKFVLWELCLAHLTQKTIIPIVDESLEQSVLPWFVKDLADIKYSGKGFKHVIHDLSENIKSNIDDKNRRLEGDSLSLHDSLNPDLEKFLTKWLKKNEEMRGEALGVPNNEQLTRIAGRAYLLDRLERLDEEFVEQRAQHVVIDKQCLTKVEYFLFIFETKGDKWHDLDFWGEKEFERWKTMSFTRDELVEPIVGIRGPGGDGDTDAFCRWLIEFRQKNREFLESKAKDSRVTYRLPTRSEAEMSGAVQKPSQAPAIWCNEINNGESRSHLAWGEPDGEKNFNTEYHKRWGEDIVESSMIHSIDVYHGIPFKVFDCMEELDCFALARGDRFAPDVSQRLEDSALWTAQFDHISEFVERQLDQEQVAKKSEDFNEVRKSIRQFVITASYKGIKSQYYNHIRDRLDWLIKKYDSHRCLAMFKSLVLRLFALKSADNTSFFEARTKWREYYELMIKLIRDEPSLSAKVKDQLDQRRQWLLILLWREQNPGSCTEGLRIVRAP